MPVDDKGNLYDIRPAEDPDATSAASQDHPANGATPPGQAVEGVTAFLVVMGLDGRWNAYLNIDQVGPLAVQRPAHRYDVLGAFAQVSVDVAAGIHAETGMQAQMQMANMIAQQQEAQKLASRLNLHPTPGRRG